ncbi:MAG: IgGFc-binding protein [Myxococcota bacterium]
MVTWVLDRRAVVACGTLLWTACSGVVDVGNSGLSGAGSEGGATSDTPGATVTSGGDASADGDAGDSGTTGSVDPDGDGSSGGNVFDVADVPPPPSGFPETCAEAESAQSSIGCTFFPIVPSFASGPQAAFVVANVSPEVAHVELSDGSSIVAQADVEPGETHELIVSADRRVNYLSGEVGEAGYELTSDRPLQAYAYFPYGNPTLTSNDASLLLPGPALGTRHRVVNYEAQSAIPDQHVTVVATEDDTEVTLRLVHPGATTEAGAGIPALDFDAGQDTLTVTLDRLEHLSVRAWEQVDGETNPFHGSVVESSAPVAVYSGVFTKIGGGAPESIHTVVPPTAVYGDRYAAATFVPVGNAEDVWRIVADVDDTVVTLTGGVNDVVELDAGEIHEVVTPASFWAEGTHAFGLVHFMSGSSASPAVVPHDCPEESLGGPGDPAMGWMFPVDNWIHRHVMPVAVQAYFRPGPGTDIWCHNHLTVVAPRSAWDEITVDGDPLPQAFDIGHEDFAYTYVPVAEGNHELVAPDHVGVLVDVYGFVNHGSYYYAGGMGLQTLNPEG